MRISRTGRSTNSNAWQSEISIITSYCLEMTILGLVYLGIACSKREIANMTIFPHWKEAIGKSTGVPAVLGAIL